MNNKQIKQIVENSKGWTYDTVLYKSPEDKKQYGESFDCLFNGEYSYIKVNGLTFKCRRIMEEFGRILFIYNHNQLEVFPNDLTTLELNI